MFRMMATSRLMNHLGLTALLDFVRFVEKLLHFLRRLCFRFDVTNFQANLPAVARMQPSAKDSASAGRAILPCSMSSVQSVPPVTAPSDDSMVTLFIFMPNDAISD